MRGTKEITLLVGTVYGTALETAEAVAAQLQNEGYATTLDTKPTLETLLADESAILVCTSTTGSGDLPSGLHPIYESLTNEFPRISGRPFGVIALGDSSYGDTFCGAGKLMHDALTELGAVPVTEPLEIDALETYEPAEEALAWASAWSQRMAQMA